MINDNSVPAHKELLRRNIEREMADFHLAGGNVTYWPTGHRVLTTKEAAEVETVALGIGYVSEHPLPSRYTFKQPRRIRRFALRRK